MTDDSLPADAAARPIGDVIAARLSRRTLLKGMAAAVAAGSGWSRGGWAEAAPGPSLSFEELPHGAGITHAVAKGYRAEVLIRWGDPLTAAAPAFDPGHLTAAAQAQQFGYNNDFIAFLPLPRNGASDRGLLCVNHESTHTGLMFPGITGDNAAEAMTAAMTEVELAAHGCSVVEIKKRENGRWTCLRNSPYNRRIDMRSSTIRLGGPAAGHPRLRTAADPGGRQVIGTLNNCAGGKTPWGTVLTCEENFHLYFAGDPDKTGQAAAFRRYGIDGDPAYPWWGRHFQRFDIEKNPNEPNRFGWVVEIDPYDPAGVPVKRTALGRFCHEGATVAVSRDGRVAVYSGDDRRFEYVYKFVTARPWDPQNPMANRDLLDDGTLYVARFHDDGRLAWLPLVHGQGPLSAENGFASQAEVLIEARRAADLLGATPMDRPEDVEPNPRSGVVYLALTSNPKRAPEQVDAANPRPDNAFGHIIAMVPPGAFTAAVDHAADRFTWELPILCGNPRNPEHGARYHPGVSDNGWLAAPDNLAFDGQGRLWIATDQGSGWQKTGFADGLYACEVRGRFAYLTRHFFRVPVGAELCGPEFTPDDRTLFVAVQHPAANGGEFWPDFRPGVPPRPAVVAITRNDGGRIGG